MPRNKSVFNYTLQIYYNNISYSFIIKYIYLIYYI